jgi:hypothetical protein
VEDFIRVNVVNWNESSEEARSLRKKSSKEELKS